MDIIIREFAEKDIAGAISVWNRVVEDGVAFPQTEPLDVNRGMEFFKEQTYTGIAVVTDDLGDEGGDVVGLYILHPNNIGRCGHLANASYAVRADLRGHHIGEKLVRHSLVTARAFGFGIMQFNAVVKSNAAALALYEKIGFVRLGVIPRGFRMKDGTYEDIVPHYFDLNQLG